MDCHHKAFVLFVVIRSILDLCKNREIVIFDNYWAIYDHVLVKDILLPIIIESILGYDLLPGEHKNIRIVLLVIIKDILKVCATV